MASKIRCIKWISPSDFKLAPANANYQNIRSERTFASIKMACMPKTFLANAWRMLMCVCACFRSISSVMLSFTYLMCNRFHMNWVRFLCSYTSFYAYAHWFSIHTVIYRPIHSSLLFSVALLPLSASFQFVRYISACILNVYSRKQLILRIYFPSLTYLATSIFHIVYIWIGFFHLVTSFFHFVFLFHVVRFLSTIFFLLFFSSVFLAVVITFFSICFSWCWSMFFSFQFTSCTSHII